MATFGEVLAAVDSGEIDLGFVGIENSIEGTVTVTIDALALEHDLLIQREVVLGIQLNLLAPARGGAGRHPAGPHLPGGRRPVPHLAGPGAARRRGRGRQLQRRGRPARGGGGRRRLCGAVAPALAAKIYGLDVLATDIEDHPENETRFVLVGRDPIPRPHGPRQDHDRGVPAHRQGRIPPGHPPGVRRPGDQPHQARVPAHQEGPRRLLLHHRPRGPPRRRAGGRLPPRRCAPRSPTSSSSAAIPRPACTARRSAATPTRPGGPPTRGSPACGRKLDLTDRPGRMLADGVVAEWTKASVLKTVDPQGSVGSNPTRSA